MKNLKSGIVAVFLIAVFGWGFWEINSLKSDIAELSLANQSLSLAVNSQNLVLDFLTKDKAQTEQDINVLVARQVANASIEQAAETKQIIKQRSERDAQLQAELGKDIIGLFN